MKNKAIKCIGHNTKNNCYSVVCQIQAEFSSMELFRRNKTMRSCVWASYLRLGLFLKGDSTRKGNECVYITYYRHFTWLF